MANNKKLHSEVLRGLDSRINQFRRELLASGYTDAEIVKAIKEELMAVNIEELPPEPEQEEFEDADDHSQDAQAYLTGELDLGPLVDLADDPFSEDEN